MTKERRKIDRTIDFTNSLVVGCGDVWRDGTMRGTVRGEAGTLGFIYRGTNTFVLFLRHTVREA